MGSHHDIKTEAAPVAMAYVEENQTLIASLANMTLSAYALDGRSYASPYTWASSGVQMALAYMPKNRLLYSGAVNGNIYSWHIKEPKPLGVLSGHTDIVMSLVTLDKIDYLASASLDKVVSIWDAKTSQQLLKLFGHKKGIVCTDYSAQYRLLVSVGFEHEACIWSPFVNNCVYRLRGHHASLVGCQAVKDTPEIITADISGVVKLWDIRNFQCVQTFAANLSGQTMKVGSKLGSFLHCNLPVKSHTRTSGNPENDARIYMASKLVLSYDQHREVHQPDTDSSNIVWVDWNEEAITIITASEHNIIVWDAILGSKSNT